MSFDSARLRKVMAFGAITVAALVVLAAAVEHALEARDRARFTAEDTFATVDGRRVRYRLCGEGKPGPAIVLVCGMMGALEQWKSIQGALCERAPVLAYDRAGMGFSDPSDAHDAMSEAEELAGLVHTLAISAPFMIVSYSSSALVARAFDMRHRDLVNGLTFIDPAVPEANDRIPPALRRSYSRNFARSFLILNAKSFVGYLRFKQFVQNWTMGPLSFEDEKEQAIIESFHHLFASAEDGFALDRSDRQVHGGFKPCEFPIGTLSTSDPSQRSQPNQRKWETAVLDAQRGITDESACPIFRHDPHGNHEKLVDDPKESRGTLELIEHVLDAARGNGAEYCLRRWGNRGMGVRSFSAVRGDRERARRRR